MSTTTARPGLARSTPTLLTMVSDGVGLRWWLRTAIAVAVVLLAVLLAPSLDERWVYTVTTVAIAATLAASLNFTMGLTGQLNLSLGAFMCFGAYLGALGSGHWGWSSERVLLVAIVGSAVAAGLLSLVIFRAKGLHFALMTAGLSLVAYGVLVNWTSVTGGTAGISTGGPLIEGGLPKPLEVGPVSLDDTRSYMVGALALMVAVVWLTTIVVRSGEGRRWTAVRDDQVLTASVGIDIAARKRNAFVLTSVLASVTGVLYAHWLGYVTPSSFTFAHASFDPLAMVMIGGGGTVSGPLVGAVVVAGLPEIFRDLAEYSVLLYGVVLLLVVLLAPRGVVGLLRSGTSWVLRRLVPEGRKS